MAIQRMIVQTQILPTGLVFTRQNSLFFFLRKKRQISWISPKEETVSMQFAPAVACQVTSGEDTEENNIC